MWAMEDRQQGDTTVTQDTEETQAGAIISHKAYPNPVITQLTVEYTLKEPSPVQVVLVATDGNIVRNIQKGTLDSGPQQETINCSGLMYGTYHLKLIAGQQIISQTIIKK